MTELHLENTTEISYASALTTLLDQGKLNFP